MYAFEFYLFLVIFSPWTAYGCDGYIFLMSLSFGCKARKGCGTMGSPWGKPSMGGNLCHLGTNLLES